MDGSDTLAGRVVADRYRLAERIGLGGMAEVRKAEDLRLGRPVAVKFLDPHLAAQPDLRRRFEDEARAAARLNHPSVVQVFDSGEWDGRPFLVMELLSGRTLADEMAGGPLPVDRVRGAAADVLGALGAAHAAGVLHRDVKPANLLIGADGSVKIADFGIAKADPIQGERSAGETESAPVTMTGQMLGTPSHLAPERVAGKPATPGTDLWALGVVCWEALAGRRAFPGSGIQTSLAVASTDLPPVREVRPDADANLAQAVDVAVRRDPAARWGSAAQMRAALFGEPAVAGLGMAAAAGTAATQVSSTGWAHDEATVVNRRDATVVAPAPAAAAPAAPLGLGQGWEMTSFGSRAAAFGLVAVAVVAGIIALAALAGGGHPKAITTKSVTATTAVRPATTTSTSTSTTTSTTVRPLAPAPPRKKGGGGGGGGGDGGGGD